MGVSMMNGTVKCDWCGKYIKTRDNGAFDHVGIGWAINGIAGAKKHYCSRACKEAAERAQGQKDAADAAEQREREQAEAEKRARLSDMESIVKDQIVAVKTFEFSEDPQEYKKQIIGYVEQYKMLKSKGDSDEWKIQKKLKKAIKERLDKEFEALKLKDEALFSALSEDYFKFVKKEKLIFKIKLWSIIGGSVAFIGALVILIVREYC